MTRIFPKTVRGKLLFAYLALIVIFSAAGLFVVSQLIHLRVTSDAFFGQYSEAEDLIISTRFTVDQISNRVLAPEAGLDTEQYAASTVAIIEEISTRFRQIKLPAGYQQEVSGSLHRFSQALSAPLKLYRRPVELMEEADAVGEVCLKQAARTNQAGLVYAIAGVVGAYNDALITNSPKERQEYEEFVSFIESHPDYEKIPSFPILKQKAIAVFTINDEFTKVRDEFSRVSISLSRKLADLDKVFHHEYLLPRQNKFTSNVKRVAWMVFFVLAFSALLGTVVGLILARRIWRPLADVGDMISRLSQGELNHRLLVKSEDELSVISNSLNAFADQLKSTMEKLENQMAEMTIVETDLRKSEEYNRSLSREYQVVLDGISESLVVFNLEKNVVWSNKQASEEFFSEIDQKASEHEGALDPESSFYLGFEQVDRSFKTGEKIEEIIRSVSGSYYRIKVFPLFDQSGKVTQVLRMLNDITDQYILREEAIRASRLVSLGELSAGVAHEINNPNSLVLVNAPIVREAVEDVLPLLEEKFRADGEFRWGGLPFSRMKDELPEMLQEMHDGSLRIQRIVDDLKNFVRKGDMVENEKVELNAAVEAAIRLTGSVVRKATDHFRKDLGPNLPTIKGNLIQFEQVVVNLIQNACLALPDRDRGLSLATAMSADGKALVMTVSDEGTGIPPENLSRITDPFFTTRRQDGGTGLGLSVSSRIVNDYGGSIEFDSEVNKGTTVTVRFPINRNGE